MVGLSFLISLLKGLDREHKDITCAVRLPRSMYQALGQCAKVENTSLSDIIREALVEKMKQVEEAERERVLKEAEYEARLRELGCLTLGRQPKAI